MKRFFSVLFVLILSLTLLAGCGKEDPVTVRIAGLKGPTSMGLVQVMEQAAEGKTANPYDFVIAGSADEITPKLVKGELDMAAIPANLASVLYNNTQGEIRLLAVNTLGVLYIVEKGSAVQSWEDLRGRTIYATGKGSTPEYTLRYLLQAHGLNPDQDVTLEWKSEPTEVVSLLQNAETGVAMLPQPYATVAQTSVEGLHTVLDLTAAWDELDNGSALVTGVLVVRKDFADVHPEAIRSFLKEYEASVSFVNTETAEAAQLIEKYGIVKAAVAQKALPYCNITFVSGRDMQPLVEGYLKVLYDQNPKAIGGELPAASFYYE